LIRCTTVIVLDRRRESAVLPTTHAALTSGFQLAFVVAAAFAALGALVAALGLPRVSPSPEAHEAQRTAVETA
jgi:hypothetical protein